MRFSGGACGGYSVYSVSDRETAARDGGTTQMELRLPPGYYLERDPDIWTLRRSDGSSVAAFSARGASRRPSRVPRGKTSAASTRRRRRPARGETAPAEEKTQRKMATWQMRGLLPFAIRLEAGSWPLTLSFTSSFTSQPLRSDRGPALLTLGGKCREYGAVPSTVSLSGIEGAARSARVAGPVLFRGEFRRTATVRHRRRGTTGRSTSVE
jgi:hypothetical protein